MMQPQLRLLDRTILRILLSYAPFLFLLLSGCKSPPAQVAGCDLSRGDSSRVAMTLRQVSADTAVQFARHPFESTGHFLTQSVTHLTSGSVGLMCKRMGLSFQRAPHALREFRPTLDPAALEDNLFLRLGTPLEPAEVKVHTCGHESLHALFEVIDSATCRLDVLMFIWGNDEVGMAIARRLAAKAGPTLPVRVLVDGGGNLAMGEPPRAGTQELNRVVCWLAEQPHVEVVRIRNPCFHFDHRKLVVADGKWAWAGGRNFDDTHFFHQFDISYTLLGPLVREMEKRFEETWVDQGAEPLPPLEPLPVPAPNAHARIVGTEPPHHDLQSALHRAIDEARHHVYLENFSLSDSQIIYKLVKARQRGADVRVVLTVTGTSSIMNPVSRVIANRLVKAGVRVYLYPGMTHFKGMSVDGLWAYTGSGNFDPLSMRRNWEIGLAISAGPVIEELEQRVFQAHFRPEWEVTEPLETTVYCHLLEMIAMVML